MQADKEMRALAEILLRIEKRPESAPPLTEAGMPGIHNSVYIYISNPVDHARLTILVLALEELAPIHLEALELRRMLQDAKDTVSWQTISSSPTVTCSYRADPSSPCHWMKMCGKVNAPLLTIIFILI